jgi:predicted aldo/keto reductase-like oxidoreductase
VHTLSIGATKPEDFDEHVKILPHLADFTSLPALLKPIEERLHAELVKTFDREWTETWHVGLPAWKETPGRVNAFEILRLRNFAKALDMISYGKMRYNLLGNADCWFPGFQATEIHDEEWQNCLRNSPHRRIIPAALREAHELLEGDSVKRLGSQK